MSTIFGLLVVFGISLAICTYYICYDPLKTFIGVLSGIVIGMCWTLAVYCDKIFR